MLNEATQKAVVIEMATPELATRLKLNADRYNTCAQMKWQVSYVNVQLPMWSKEKEHERAARKRFQENDSGVKRCLQGNSKNTDQVEDDDQEQHVRFEEETGMGTFDVCALEDVEENEDYACEHHHDGGSVRVDPEIMMMQCEGIMAKLKKSTKQRNETHEHSGSSRSGQRDGGSS